MTATLRIEARFSDGTPVPYGKTSYPNGGGYRSARDCAIQLARRHRNISFAERNTGSAPRIVERLPNGIRLIERSRIFIITYED